MLANVPEANALSGRLIMQGQNVRALEFRQDLPHVPGLLARKQTKRWSQGILRAIAQASRAVVPPNLQDPLLTRHLIAGSTGNDSRSAALEH
jgi:hypothetical protein